MTKDEAREETLRRWRELPAEERQDAEQARVFAASLAEELDFHTMGNAHRVILAWLLQELRGQPAWGNIPPEGMMFSGPSDQL